MSRKAWSLTRRSQPPSRGPLPAAQAAGPGPERESPGHRDRAAEAGAPADLDHRAGAVVAHRDQAAWGVPRTVARWRSCATAS